MAAVRYPPGFNRVDQAQVCCSNTLIITADTTTSITITTSAARPTQGQASEVVVGISMATRAAATNATIDPTKSIKKAASTRLKRKEAATEAQNRGK